MMSSSAGNVTPGGPAHLGEGPALPMEERTTDLQAWRAANEEKAARRRGFLLDQVASRPRDSAPATAEPDGGDEPATAEPDGDDEPAAPSQATPELEPQEPAFKPSDGPVNPSTPPAPGPASPPARAATPPRQRRSSGSRLDVKAVCEAYVAGMSPPQIAKKFGCEPATVRRALRGAGVKLRDDRATYSGSQPFPTSPEQVEQVVAAYASGLSIIQTGKKVGIAAKRVRRVLEEQGVPIRPAAHMHKTAGSETASAPLPPPAPPQEPPDPAPSSEPAPPVPVEPAEAAPTDEPPEPVETRLPARAQPTLAQELVALANDLAAFVGRIRRVAALAEEGTA